MMRVRGSRALYDPHRDFLCMSKLATFVEYSDSASSFLKRQCGDLQVLPFYSSTCKKTGEYRLHERKQLIVRNASCIAYYIVCCTASILERAPPFASEDNEKIPPHLGNYTHSHEDIEAPTYTCVATGECDVCTPFEKVNIQYALYA